MLSPVLKVLTSLNRRILCIKTCCYFSVNSETFSRNKERKKQNRSIRLQLAAAYRGLSWYGLNEGLCNHLSAKAPDPNSDLEIMLLIPYGMHWDEVTPSNLIGINEKNEVVEGKGEPEITALCIHRGIYSVNPSIHCIMHTHMQYATSLSCLHSPELQMIHQNSARFYDDVAYDKSYGGLGDNFEEGKRLGNILGNRKVLFMGSHGILTVGDCIAVAFDNLYYLERAAMFQVTALSTGQKLRTIPQDVLRKTKKQISESINFYAASHLNYMIRKCQGVESDFKC